MKDGQLLMLRRQESSRTLRMRRDDYDTMFNQPVQNVTELDVLSVQSARTSWTSFSILVASTRKLGSSMQQQQQQQVVVVGRLLQQLVASSYILLQYIASSRVRVQIKTRFFSKKYCSSYVSTQRCLNVQLDSPRSEKKSVPFRIEKLNFLRKLWSLAFLAKKLVLISFFSHK